jgi:mannose-6-phosphate isomerase-like protein (cupin superfamily)
MESQDLATLQRAVESLLTRDSFVSEVDELRETLGRSESFVWMSVPLQSVDVTLPHQIASCWVFVLKGGTSSGCHKHPNSVQHMIALNGSGTALIGGTASAIVPYDSPGHSIEEKWQVIDTGVPHEFLPEGEDMAVVSFHTCPAEELEEIDCDSGDSRLYESAGN